MYDINAFMYKYNVFTKCKVLKLYTYVINMEKIIINEMGLNGLFSTSKTQTNKI